MMIPQRLAILDLGTNTFHLLIAEVNPDLSFKVLCKMEEFVQLGENGLSEIGKQPFERGLQQIRLYKTMVDEWQPQQVVAFGTAAIRNASNGDAFINAVKAIYPMDVRKITGDEEAELICLGVRQAVALPPEPVLIMDIGGGSTEFIIANDREIFWKQSFPAGASVLKQRFHHTEPISDAESIHLQKFLDEILQPLLKQREHYKISRLVGASGSFDTFAEMLMRQGMTAQKSGNGTSLDFSPKQFHALYLQLLHSNLEQRLVMEGMKTFRAGMIVVAAMLTNFVLQQFQVQEISQSAYALKEGVLWKLIRKEKV